MSQVRFPPIKPNQVYVHRRTPDGPIVLTSTSNWEAFPPCDYVTVEDKVPLATIIEEDPRDEFEKWSLQKPSLKSE